MFSVRVSLKLETAIGLKTIFSLLRNRFELVVVVLSHFYSTIQDKRCLAFNFNLEYKILSKSPDSSSWVNEQILVQFV